MGATLRYAEDERAYSVFHFSAGSFAEERDVDREDLSPYLRGRRQFQRNGIEYSLETVFSLPDFDTLGHDLELCFDLLHARRAAAAPQAAAAFWNPGQGHLPAAFRCLAGADPSIHIAGRDSLECRITARNLSSAGAAPSGTFLLHSEQELGQAFPEHSLDLLVAMPKPVPRTPWQADLAEAARRLLKPGGELLLAASSTEMHRFLQGSAGLALIASKKRERFRAALLRSSAGPTPP